MATFVLVHGAWHGSWCWKRVRKALQVRGHEVFTPTLTGVAERSHLLSPHVNLETHIEDVVNLIRWEELSDVVLCGHSYGGCVISGVADRIPDRIGALVYLDAFVLEDGQSLHDTLPPFQKNLQLEGAMRDGEGWKVSPIPAEVFNVVADKRAWVDRRCRPQALATFESPALLSGKHLKVPQRLYILADGWDPSPFRHFAAQAEGKLGWRVAKMPCGHDVMVDLPKELAAELTKLV